MPDEQEIKYLRAEVVRMTGQLADARQEGMRNVVEWSDEICPHVGRDGINVRSCSTW